MYTKKELYPVPVLTVEVIDRANLFKPETMFLVHGQIIWRLKKIFVYDL